MNSNPLIMYFLILNLYKIQYKIVQKRIGPKYYEVPIPLPFKRQYLNVFTIILKNLKKNNQNQFNSNFFFYKKLILIFLEIITKPTNFLKQELKNLKKKIIFNRAYTHFR